MFLGFGYFGESQKSRLFAYRQKSRVAVRRARKGK
ncbi:hypothetical protein CSE899_04937 [Cronobacter sakazakii E899]|nr:hypothetical protein CSE899_04937 [Cronobacter sakazakii E899]